ncbi:unnamed protein product [Soboliphyme baturini]|uniref:REJ domain-containing protein n=1 Tax=Soboliphyme baturini TaxID=241478 RepID=A0A183ITH2_9BILA|nr:unnamed protein product [Soboliphyme baturini]
MTASHEAGNQNLLCLRREVSCVVAGCRLQDSCPRLNDISAVVHECRPLSDVVIGHPISGCRKFDSVPLYKVRWQLDSNSVVLTVSSQQHFVISVSIGLCLSTHSGKPYTYVLRVPNFHSHRCQLSLSFVVSVEDR